MFFYRIFISRRSSLRPGLLLLWWLVWGSAFGQSISGDSASRFVPEFRIHGGRIIKNYPSFPHRDASFVAQFDMGFQTSGGKPWHSDMRFPEAGISFAAGSLGNGLVLGNLVAAMPYLGWRLNTHTQWELNFKLGLGFAWFFKPYHELTNPENTLMGSSLANITQLSVSATIPINNQMCFDGGFSFFHFSNGHTRLPNLGINMPCVFAGIKLKPTTTRHGPRFEHPDSLSSRYQMVVELLAGIHEFGESTEPVGGISYPVYGAGLGIRWLPGRLHTFSAAIEWNYYASFYDFAILNRMTDHQEWMYASTVIAYVGHEYLMGHLGLDTRVGFYLFNPFRKDYQNNIQKTNEGAKLINTNKLGINWYLFSPSSAQFNIRLGIYIKANLGQADYAGAGVSIIF